MSFFLTFTPFFLIIIMRSPYVLLMSVVCCGMLSSCFKDEPLNAECDIEEAYIHADNPEEMFFNASDSLIKVLYNEHNIDFKVRKETDLTAIAPRFRITEGATIVPENGSVQDFSNGPVKYTVTSEDGQWSREYYVSVNIQTQTVSDTIYYDFERYALNSKSKYYIWSDLNPDGTEAYNWATGNPGFAVSRPTAKPEEYPTTPWVDGQDGSAVKLTTSDTGPFGALKNMRIASGNLFIGRFDATVAIQPGGAMKATMFGLKYTTGKKPVKLIGNYKYKPGAVYQDKYGKPVEGKTDTGDIYAVLYKNTDSNGNPVVLYGDNVLTSPQIVAIARLDKVENTDTWTEFEVDFNYTQEVDESLLDNYGYNLAVVFSSSIEGANFEGAIGSTMFVDKVRVICETTE